MCPHLYALWAQSVNDGAWEEGAPGARPQPGGFHDHCAVFWTAQGRVFKLPLHEVGPCKPLLILSSHPHWALLPGANLVIGGGGAAPASPPTSLGQGPVSAPPHTLQTLEIGQAHCQLSWAAEGAGLEQGAFLSCSRRPSLASQPHGSLPSISLEGVKGSPPGMCTHVSQVAGAFMPTLTDSLLCELWDHQAPHLVTRPRLPPPQHRGCRGCLRGPGPSQLCPLVVGGEALSEVAPSSGVDPFPPVAESSSCEPPLKCPCCPSAFDV